MERDNLVSEYDEQPRLPQADGIVISVCTTCKSPAGETGLPGQDLLAATKAAMGDSRGVSVRAVQCLGVCKRPATVAVTAPDGYTFIFGDLQTESGAAAIASFANAYPQANFGLVPWRERAEVLRKGLIARIPPVTWSPEDGRPPK
jgi:predicted metal-binding protein